MVTISSAEKALKDLYLGVVSDQLNMNINPFYAKIKKTTSDVWGKNIVKVVSCGLNGGIGAGTETGNLPTPVGNTYAQLRLSLKNLYGTIEISDKAIRASENSAGAFVNLLNAEMEGLLKASKFNFGRMLFGDGKGKLATTATYSGNTDRSYIKVDSVRNLMEGMVIDVYNTSNNTLVASGLRIILIDRNTKILKVTGTLPESVISSGNYLTLQSSKDLELTGLGAIFQSTGIIYGVDRGENKWLVPYLRTSAGSISSGMIQTAIDSIDERAGSQADIIISSYDVRRFYLDYLSLTRSNIDYMNLDGGFKAISYSGIPMVADRFVEDGTMYILNSDDFKLHQLCDWRWLEGENGKILMQKAGSPTYTATLVKYADLMCDKPIGQAKISGITAAA
ncbi:MAG TPA: phage major capsid protein [Clostridiales bacterium]|nr:phage major capsid protein [Clostridiales bacterium]